MTTPYEQNPNYFLHLDSGIWVRLVPEGGRYGLDGCLIHDKAEPIVEFYDQEFNHNPWLGVKGQFISRYNLSTLLDHESGGTDLYGGQPKWQIDYREFWYVRQWLQARYP